LKAVDLYHFSGTGNTLLIVQSMARTFLDRGVAVRLHPIETTDSFRIAISDTLGLAFPVAVQSTYPFVWRFINALPKGEGKPAFFVDTLAGYSGGIVRPLRDLLLRKGYVPLGAKEIIMPNNLSKTPASETANASIIRKGMDQAIAFAAALATNRTEWKTGFLTEYGMLFMYLLAIGMMSKPVQHLLSKAVFLNIDAKRCARCHLCVSLCPVGNIRLPDGKRDSVPKIGNTCQLCMRCVAYCPSSAIHFGRWNRGGERYHAVSLSEIQRYYRNDIE